MRYDALGRPYNLSFPDETRVTTIRDPLGNVVREIDALGRTTTMEYAGMGVLTRLIDAGGRAWRFEYTSKERLERITNPRGEVHAFARDHAGRVLEETTFDGRVLQYRWLASGRLGAILYPDGTHRTFTYDRAGALVSDGASDGSVTAFGRDRAGRIVAAVIEEGGARVETVFERDPLGRLVAERQGDQVTRFRYDAHGRRTARVLPNGDETRYRYGRRMAKRVRPEERREARTSDADTVSYVWDLRDRLREVRFPSGHRVVMTYDAFGRRVRKEVIGVEGICVRSVTFVWDGDALAAELDRVKGARSFAHAPGTLVPLLQQERGEVFAYVNDHLGTPKELLDRRGLVAWSAAHAAWGQVVEVQGDPVSALNTRGRVSSPFRLLGQYADEETGLCATRFRYFDPAVGRWLSPDPLGIAGGLTAFGFDGCPTSDVDPLGLSTGFFRGGSSVEPKPGEYKIKDGLVQPTHGISVFSNPDKTAKWGTHEIESIPPELQIKQRGKDPEHYEIMPKEPMSEEQYKAKL